MYPSASSRRCLSRSRAHWATPRAVTWPPCRRSYLTHRTVWYRVPWTREERPPLPPGQRAHASSAGTREDFREYSRDAQSRKKTNKGPGWIMFQTRIHVRTRGLEVWLYPLLSGILAHCLAQVHFGSWWWTFCWRGCLIQDTFVVSSDATGHGRMCCGNQTKSLYFTPLNVKAYSMLIWNREYKLCRCAWFVIFNNENLVN